MKLTQDEIIVRHLEHNGGWIPSHELQGRITPFGFIGGAGAVRAREIARNDCADHLKNRIEREKGSKIGLDWRFTYFRAKRATQAALQI